MNTPNATRRPETAAPEPRASLGLALALSLLYSAIPAAAAPANAAHASAYRGIPTELLVSIRDGFYLAEKGMDATLKAINFMEAALPGPAAAWPGVARAYSAALEGLIGKHDTRLTMKFNKVNEAIKAFDGIAEAFPSSLEIRFLRYAFYSQLPAFFGVGRFVKPDLEAIITMLEAGNDPFVPAAQQTDMADWLLAEASLSQAERRRVTAARAALSARR